MKGTETIKIEQPFEGDGNRIYYVNGGRCSGKVNKTINELVVYINNLLQENQELKKQLEEYKRLGFKHLNDKCNKLENQRKEFIEYLRNLSNWYDADGVKQGMVNGILNKYKEIIGVSDENNIK